jgi:hypothetical protein
MEDFGLTQGLLAFRDSVISFTLATLISSSVTKVSAIDRGVCSGVSPPASTLSLRAARPKHIYQTRVHGYERERE